MGNLLDAIDADVEDAKARELAGLTEDQEPTKEQLQAAQDHLRSEALKPLAFSPKLRQAILNINRAQDQVLDQISLDSVTVSLPAPELRAREVVTKFKEFIEEHRDEIDALQVLYSKPFGERLTRAQIEELANAIQAPPHGWTTEQLWEAYERLEKDRVRGASQGRLWTDIVSLARHALHPEEDLVPFADVVNERFDAWLESQTASGKQFTEDQLVWLRLIRDQIVVDYEVCPDDLDQVRVFQEQGGLGRAFKLFGNEISALLTDLNTALVA